MVTYIQGYIIDLDKIQKRLKLADQLDRRMDAAFCKILDAIDIQETPLETNIINGKTQTIIMLSPDAYAEDVETLEAKGLKPTKFLEGIADAVLSGPFIMEYDTRIHL